MHSLAWRLGVLTGPTCCWLVATDSVWQLQMVFAFAWGTAVMQFAKHSVLAHTKLSDNPYDNWYGIQPGCSCQLTASSRLKGALHLVMFCAISY